jgi:hypothetical protein
MNWHMLAAQTTASGSSGAVVTDYRHRSLTEIEDAGGIGIAAGDHLMATIFGVLVVTAAGVLQVRTAQNSSDATDCFVDAGSTLFTIRAA